MRKLGFYFYVGMSLLSGFASADDAFVAVPPDFGGNEVPVGAKLVIKQAVTFVVDQSEVMVKQLADDGGDQLICGIRLYDDKTSTRRVIPAGTVFTITDRSVTKEDAAATPGICFKDGNARDKETLNYQLASAGGALVGISCQLVAHWVNDVGTSDGNLNQCDATMVPGVDVLSPLFDLTAPAGSLETVIH